VGTPIGQTVGRYVLYDAIASGGMATVHFARMIGPVGFNRTVAVKRLHPHFADDPEFVSMFLDEARLAARIRHPNVVPTIDVVALKGELFLVMDYVPGETLARLVGAAAKAGVQPPMGTVLSIVLGALYGLQAAHQATNENGEPLEIVHRDISPQNILVGIDGVARVLDFGVAKAAFRLQSTRDGQIKGKLSYMAPEQIAQGPVDRRADIYALSIVLWEALTRRRLFSGDDVGAVVHEILNLEVAPPGQFAPGIPAELDAIVLRGLARDPAARFQTAHEMAEELEGIAPLPTPREVGRWVERFAGEGVARRAARLAEIESGRADASPSLEAEKPLGETRPALSPSLLEGESTSTDAQLVTDRSAKPRARRTGVYLALGGAAVGVAATWASLRTTTPPMTSSEPAPTMASALAAPAPLVAPAPAESAVSVPPSVTASASVENAPSARPSAPVRPRKVERPRTPTAQCDPPYTMKDGIKIWKAGCR
jgi:eukaryotic-like serine/threonine-protein kinase